MSVCNPRKSKWFGQMGRSQALVLCWEVKRCRVLAAQARMARLRIREREARRRAGRRRGRVIVAVMLGMEEEDAKATKAKEAQQGRVEGRECGLLYQYQDPCSLTSCTVLRELALSDALRTHSGCVLHATKVHYIGLLWGRTSKDGPKQPLRLHRILPTHEANLENDLEGAFVEVVYSRAAATTSSALLQGLLVVEICTSRGCLPMFGWWYRSWALREVEVDVGGAL